METVVAFLDEEWESLRRMFSNEEADHFSFGSSSTFWAVDGANTNMVGVDDGSLFHSNSDTNLQYFSPESSNSSGGGGGDSNSVFFPVPTHENHHYYYSDSNHFQETNNMESMNFCAMDKLGINNLPFPIFPDVSVTEDFLCMKEEITSDRLRNTDDQAAIFTADHIEDLRLTMKRKFDVPEAHAGAEEQKNDKLSETPPNKKSRVSREAKQGKKNSISKKNQKLMIITPSGNDHHEEETNGGTNGRSSSCSYSSEDDSNASQQEQEPSNGGGGGANSNSKALDSNGKTRASRGAATDPQSLYARKRRERINERLRILQNLVPNGTKVDISTMLEEAVHYVKFLQLQIKLLSSDELWMFTPIAYNGMDIGLCHKISPIL